MLKSILLTKSFSPTIVITANGEVQTHEESTVYDKELEKYLTMKVLDNTRAVLSLRKLCDENGYSYEWINGQKLHLIEDGIRIICNTENFVPIVVPGLTSSSSTSSSSSRTPIKQESRSSSTSSSSPSSPTVRDISVRERKDAADSDISPVPVSELVDDRLGKPGEIQANKNPKPHKKPDRTGKPVWWFWDPGMVARIKGNFVGWWNSITRRFSRQFISWSLFRAHYKETWGFG